MKVEEGSLKDQIEVFAQDKESNKTSTSKRKSAKGKSYLLDLRIQSPEALGVLGLGGLDTAPALVRLCKAKGINIIGIADFFSAKLGGGNLCRNIQALNSVMLKPPSNSIISGSGRSVSFHARILFI